MSLFERDYRTLRTIRRYFFPELSPLRPIICCALCTVKIHGELKVDRSHCTKVDRRTRKYDVLGHNNSHTHSTQLNSHTLLIQTVHFYTNTTAHLLHKQLTHWKNQTYTPTPTIASVSSLFTPTPTIVSVSSPFLHPPLCVHATPTPLLPL